jgi:hypothetical protein
MQSTLPRLLKSGDKILLIGVVSVLCAGSAMAKSVWGVSHGARLLSEIVLSAGEVLTNKPSSSRSTSEAATESRNRAREAIADAALPNDEIATIIIAPDEDSSMTPGRSSVPPDNRSKASENVSRNLNKARRYAQDQQDGPTNKCKFAQFGTTTGVLGKDGVMLIVCDGVNNNAGRIGDDSQSGNVFSIIINGKTTMARCK